MFAGPRALALSHNPCACENSKPRRVLLLLPSLSGGGPERVFTTLLQHLDRMRFELHLGVLRALGPYRAEIPRDVAVHDLKRSRLRYGLAAIVRLIWKLQPAVVLSTYPHLNMGLALARSFLPRSAKILMRETSVVPHAFIETENPRLWTWLYRRYYGRADRIVCLTDSMIDDMKQHFDLPARKFVRIYNPLDLDRLREGTQSDQNPYTGGRPRIVAAGRLWQIKGFDLLIEAMPRVLLGLPSAQLTILGCGPLSDDLNRQIQKLGLQGKVRLLAFQRNPWPYFKHADLFVSSSRYESFGNARLEALALGTPVVATDCPGGIRELHACVPGITLVPPEDPNALAEAIVSTYATAGHHRPIPPLTNGLCEFDLQRIVKEYSNLFV